MSQSRSRYDWRMRTGFVRHLLQSVVIGLVCWSHPATAQQADAAPAVPGATTPAPTASPTRTRVWYGWQTLIGLGISDLFLAGAVVAAGSGGDPSTKTAILATPGIAGNILSGPIVHYAHGHAGRAFESLGIIVGSAGVGALLGMGIGFASGGSDTGGNESGPSIPAIFAGLGAIVGLATGIIVDLAVLSYDERDVTETQPRR